MIRELLRKMSVSRAFYQRSSRRSFAAKHSLWIGIQLAIIPLVTFASIPVSELSVNNYGRYYTAPEDMVRALEQVGVRVTEICRDENANYGAENSLHKTCQAADIGRETTVDQIAALAALGFCAEWHSAGTAPHYHVERCDESQNIDPRLIAQGQSGRVGTIRSVNAGAASDPSLLAYYRSLGNDDRDNSRAPASTQKIPGYQSVLLESLLRIQLYQQELQQYNYESI